MLFQVCAGGSQSGWQFFGWILVFICLVVTNEIARRTRVGGLFFFVVLPIALTIYFIAITSVLGRASLGAAQSATYVHMNSWFHYAKLYAATFGCIGFMILSTTGDTWERLTGLRFSRS